MSTTKQYIMSVDDIAEFQELKETSLYKDYINTIINSPIFIAIANDHVKNIDITDDIEKIMANGSMTASKFNKLFKDNIKNMAISIVADSLILKDIIDVNFEDTVEDLDNNFKTKYLLGLADEQYYLEAKEEIETNNPDTTSLLYQGYMAYKKRKDEGMIINGDLSKVTKVTKKKRKSKTTSKVSSKKTTVDLDSNDIQF